MNDESKNVSMCPHCRAGSATRGHDRPPAWLCFQAELPGRRSRATDDWTPTRSRVDSAWSPRLLLSLADAVSAPSIIDLANPEPAWPALVFTETRLQVLLEYIPVLRDESIHVADYPLGAED